MNNIDYNMISRKWYDLGEIKDYLFFFEDPIIPSRYIKDMQHGFFLNINNNIYHFKDMRQKKYYIRELLGEMVSEKLSLKTVKSIPVKLTISGKEKIGLLSSWARQANVGYFSLDRFEEHLDVAKNPLGILNLLEKMYPNSEVNKEFRDLLARDYFTHELDRKDHEITFESQNGFVQLGYLSDYEFEFYRITGQIGVEKCYQMDFKNDYTLNFVRQDERLMESFRKVLKLNLCILLKELEEQKGILITKQELDAMKSFQENSKEDIKKTLRL